MSLFSLVSLLLFMALEVRVQSRESLPELNRALRENKRQLARPGPRPTTPAPVLAPAPTKAPTNPPTTTYSFNCGCSSCTTAVLNSYTGDKPTDGTSWPKCGDRIDWLMSSAGGSRTLQYSCRLVAGVEFPVICGACNPDLCDGKSLPAFTPLSFTSVSGTNLNLPITDDDPLYCFPPIASRKRYTGVWSGAYIVDVKESPSSCGPGLNIFSRDRVSISGDELVLEYANNMARGMGTWYASEVRVLLPGQENGSPSFGYGKYEFSVKSTQVIDVSTGAVIDNKLPNNMILGLFTWDPTDNNANANHETDIEIARWGIEAAGDGQFLVQPADQPASKHRFYTGSTVSGTGTYNQGVAQTYSFDWQPAVISWTSSAGGGQSHYISEEKFLFYHQLGLYSALPDLIQCLPSNMEVRMSLWKGSQSWSTITVNGKAWSKNFKIRVVIDNFKYTPSASMYVASGGYCSKHCHCEFQCINGKCTAS